MNPEDNLVQKCLRLIEEKLHWGHSKNWHSDVFIELSELIQKETQVLLSPTTLKRVWGKVKYKNAPSITTLNTLAQFAGYQNWRDFKSKGAEKSTINWTQRINANLGIIMLSASLMTIVFISFYSLKGTSNTQSIDVSKIGFSSKPLSVGLPNSVVFNLDLEEIKSDSIRIQQYWDTSKTIPLKRGQRQATGQYYYPGYYRAKLIVDNNIIKEHDLFIESEGWLATLDYEPVPKYLTSGIFTGGNLSLSETSLTEMTQSEQPLISSFHHVNNYNVSISGDNFVLKTAVKNIYREKWAVCQQMSIYILGTKSAIVVPFSIPGCVSEIGIMLSDVYLSGKEHDLSALGLEMSSYRELKIEVKDKKLSVFADSIKLFSRTYNKSIGNIVGFRYRFRGAGAVDYIKVSDLKEATYLINEDFNTSELK